MNTDKFDGVDAVALYTESDVHGKPDRRKTKRPDRVKHTLRSIDLRHMDLDDMDDLDIQKFEKFK